MGTYRKEWDCCGSVTETEAWEPEHCPFCTDDAAPFRKDAERYRKLRAQAHSETPLVVDPLNPALGYNPEGLDAALDALPAVGAA